MPFRDERTVLPDCLQAPNLIVVSELRVHKHGLQANMYQIVKLRYDVPEKLAFLTGIVCQPYIMFQKAADGILQIKGLCMPVRW